jgi:general stress protein 26
MTASDNQKIMDIMKKAQNFAFLSTSEGDQPRGRPMATMLGDDMSIWMATSGKSRKVQQIKKNPKVSLVFLVPPQGDQAATVLGEAVIVTDMEEKKKVWEMAAYDPAQFWPDGPETEDYCVLKINIKQVEWWESFETGMKIYEP